MGFERLAQWLRAYSTYANDSGLVTIIHMGQLTITCSSSFKGPHIPDFHGNLRLCNPTHTLTNM